MVQEELKNSFKSLKNRESYTYLLWKKRLISLNVSDCSENEKKKCFCSFEDNSRTLE